MSTFPLARLGQITALFSAFILQNPAFPSPLASFHPSEPFHEQVQEKTLPNNVRSFTNAPGDFDPAKPTHLIIYLLPNGNTIEQTLGRQLSPGDDWHYDIQHIAAQARLLRHLDPSRNIVLTLLEAPGKSWPKFRADHQEDNPGLIRALVQSAVDELPASHAPQAAGVSLVAHSGGGSFLFGYLNSSDPIAAYVGRIVFLDANYAYSDEEHHGEKLLGWLKSSPDKRLVVFCYDDRNVTLNGKKIVSETGGTWRSTQRMIDFFSRSAVSSVPTDKAGPFEHHSFLNGQAQFFLHPNPENKILHTVLIGEMNAFLEALTLETPLHDKYGSLGGPRAYTQYVQREEAGSGKREAEESASLSLSLPLRPAHAPAGSAFVEQVQSLPASDREALVIKEVLSGNVPSFLRTLVPITVTAAGSDGQHTATYYVTPDVLTLGSDTDAFRIPLTPAAAQLIAGKLDCSLITRKISNDIYAHAAIKLEPHPLTEKREAAATLYQHHQIIEDQLKQQANYKPGLLVAGHKKDVVIALHLPDKPHKVAIYGWHKLDGKAIQPLYLGHADYYVDYSHGIRLMSNHLVVDGRPMTVEQVLSSPSLSPLLSDEGPLPVRRYPTTLPVHSVP